MKGPEARDSMPSDETKLGYFDRVVPSALEALKRRDALHKVADDEVRLEQFKPTGYRRDASANEVKEALDGANHAQIADQARDDELIQTLPLQDGTFLDPNLNKSSAKEVTRIKGSQYSLGATNGTSGTFKDKRHNNNERRDKRGRPKSFRGRR